MDDTAANLGGGGVEQVGADRRRRMDAEQQDQQRRHQRAAAHTGHADQEADAEARNYIKGINHGFRPSLGRLAITKVPSWFHRRGARHVVRDLSGRINLLTTAIAREKKESSFRRSGFGGDFSQPAGTSRNRRTADSLPFSHTF